MARVEFTSNSLSPNLHRMPTILRRNIYQVMRFHEPQIRSQAKTNAKWEDQTGNARNGLNSTVQVLAPDVYALVLFGSVKYQIWLEVRFAGRYAIIVPTIRAYAPVVLASFTKLLERMGVGK